MRMFQTDTCEVFPALARRKRTYRTSIPVMETDINFPSMHSIRTCVTSQHATAQKHT